MNWKAIIVVVVLDVVAIGLVVNAIRSITKKPAPREGCRKDDPASAGESDED